MNYVEIRKLLLKVFIGFLGLTALIAIISVLSGDLDKFKWKIIATTFTISAVSVCSMLCATFIEKKKQAGLGLLGIFLSISAGILLIIGIWPEIKSDGYWKTTITFVVAAIAFVHAFLLVLPELDDKQKWVQKASSVSIGVLALQIVMAVWGDIKNDGYYRLLAVIAIIAGLETLVIPILMKLRKGNGEEKGDGEKSQKLVLEKLGGDIYKDSSGKKYQLKETNSEQENSINT